MKLYIALALMYLASVSAQSESEFKSDVSNSTEKSLEEGIEPKSASNTSIHQSHGSNFAGYREPCEPEHGDKCVPYRNLHCDADNSTCECIANTVYSQDHQHCFEISAKQKQWECEADFQCTQSSYGQLSRCNASKTCECYSDSGKQVVLGKNDVCYLKKTYSEACTSNEECKASMAGEAICLGLETKTQGICNCEGKHLWNEPLNECLKIGSIGSSCKINAQCQDTQGLGMHSRCNDVSKCECWDAKEKTGYLNTKCYLKRGANETCGSREECVVGYHKDADCLAHEAYRNEWVCQCLDGKTCENSGIRMSPGSVFLVIAGIWILNFVKF